MKKDLTNLGKEVTSWNRAKSPFYGAKVVHKVKSNEKMGKETFRRLDAHF